MPKLHQFQTHKPNSIQFTIETIKGIPPLYYQESLNYTHLLLSDDQISLKLKVFGEEAKWIHLPTTLTLSLTPEAH